MEKFLKQTEHKTFESVLLSFSLNHLSFIHSVSIVPVKYFQHLRVMRYRLRLGMYFHVIPLDRLSAVCARTSSQTTSEKIGGLGSLVHFTGEKILAHEDKT